MSKHFVITIDTECDNQWNPTQAQTTGNARCIPRFQELCDTYGFKPVYLVDYAMGSDPFLVKYLRSCLKRNACEIGMHLHAWNTPPDHPIDNSTVSRPYLIEYPRDIMESKIQSITALLEDRMETKMLSHRAGRWATNRLYFELLEKYGYIADCSITPGLNWKSQIGYQTGGSDYRKEKRDIHPIEGLRTLMEVPMTVKKIKGAPMDTRHGLKAALKSTVRSLIGKNVWLRPSASTAQEIERLLCDEIGSDAKHLEFMMHSSELMPGGSPYYQTDDDVDHMYEYLNALFLQISKSEYTCATLQEVVNSY